MCSPLTPTAAFDLSQAFSFDTTKHQHPVTPISPVIHATVTGIPIKKLVIGTPKSDTRTAPNPLSPVFSPTNISLSKTRKRQGTVLDFFQALSDDVVSRFANEVESVCVQCSCTEFTPDPWKRHICKICRHSDKAHQPRKLRNLLIDRPDLREKIQIITEILESEQTYVDYLNTLNESAMQPIQTNYVNFFPPHDPQLASLFTVFKEIVALNQRFLFELHARVKNMDETLQIGDIFVKYSKLFTIYGQYARNYEKLVRMVNRTAERSSLFLKFLDGVENHVMNHGNNGITSLLIMPIQRIPRYVLLLEELLKKTSLDDSDYDNLQNALVEVRQTADHIDLTIGIRNESDKLRQISGNFIEGTQLVSSNRIYIKHGDLLKIDRRGRRTSYVFHLFSDILTYSKLKSRGLLKLHQKLPLSTVRVENSKLKHGFEVISKAKSIRVIAEDEATKREWIKAIKTAIANLDVVDGDETAPIWVRDHETPKCQACEMKFTWHSRRHHCRNCGVIVCGKCSSKRRILEHIDSRQAVRVCDKCWKAGYQSSVEESKSHQGSLRSDRSINLSDDLDLFDGEISRSSSTSSAGTLHSSTIHSYLTMSSSAGDSVSPTYLQPVEEDINELGIMDKIISYEQQYCQHLKLILDNFVMPITNGDFMPKLKRKGALEGKTLSIMASRLEHIHNLSARLLEDLEGCVEPSQEVELRGVQLSHILKNYAEYFTLHIQYCSDLPDAVEILSIPEVAKFVHQIESNVEDEKLCGQTVHYLLGLPGLRLREFLHDLRRAQSETIDSDPEMLGVVVKDISNANEYIKLLMKERNERHMRVLDTQFYSTFSVTDNPKRALIHQGMLKKVSKKKVIQYRFHLFSDILTYSAQKNSGFFLHRKMELSELQIADYQLRKNAFEIRSSEKSFIVICDSRISKNVWLRMITLTKMELQTSLVKSGSLSPKDLTKNIETLAPVWAPDSAYGCCSLCKCSFNHIKRRHHCRNCGVLICGNCSKGRILIPHIEKKKKLRVCKICFKRTESNTLNIPDRRTLNVF